LASFINEKLATAFLEKVEARNTDAAIERFEQSGATYYRVLYNKPFEDKKSAQKEFGALYESLKELKIKDLWVVESDKLFDKKTKMKNNAEKSDGIDDEIDDEIKTAQKIKETPIENKSINFEDNIVINDKPSATDKKADEISKTNDIKLIRLVVEGLEKPDLWTRAEIKMKNLLKTGGYAEIYEFIAEFKSECDKNYKLKEFKPEKAAYDYYLTNKSGFADFISGIPADKNYRRFLNNLTNKFDKEGRLGELESVFNIFIDKISDNYLFSYVKARILCILNKYEESIGYCDKALQLYPEYAYANGLKGDNLYNLYLYDKADALYQKAIGCFDEEITAAPKDVDAYNNKGLVLYYLGRYDEATAYYDKALAIDPNDAYAHNGKGSALNGLKRYDEAIGCYNKAIEIDPNGAYAYNGKGNALLNVKRYDEAIANYDKAIEIDPRYTDAYNGKGSALSDLKRYDEAITYYDKAMEINPRYKYAYYNKGLTLYYLKQYEEAITNYDKAIEIDPKYVYAFNGKGIALNELKRYDEAIGCYNKAIEIDPNDAYAYNKKGNTLSYLNLYDEAIACYDKALEIDPNCPDALLNKYLTPKSLENKSE